MNTNAADLNRLHDIITAQPAPWWPLAPGWRWVMAFALGLALVIAIKSLIRWQRNRYRREALAELAGLEILLKNSNERAAALSALSALLRRTALTAFPREEVAALTGAKWFEFLDHSGGNPAFGLGPGAILENSVYDPRTVAKLDERKLQELASLIRNWIKHHNPKIMRTEKGVVKKPPTDASPPLRTPVPTSC